MCLLKEREMQHYKGRKGNWVVDGGGRREDVRHYSGADEERGMVLSKGNTCKFRDS